MHRIGLALVITLLIGWQVALAQDAGSCEAELGEAIALLERAQAATIAGEAGARQLISDARAVLARAARGCDVSGDEPAFDLSRSFTLETPDGDLTLQMPADWGALVQAEQTAVLINSLALLDIDMDAPEPPTLEPGQVAILVGLIETEFFPHDVAEGEMTPLKLLEMLAADDDIEEVGKVVSAPEAFSVDDRRAAQIRLSGNSEMTFYVADKTNSAETGVYAMMMLLTAAGSEDTAVYQPLARAMLETMRFDG